MTYTGHGRGESSALDRPHEDDSQLASEDTAGFDEPTVAVATRRPPEGKQLDFLVIGAQRAGTTSMWMYLRTHPQLYLPPNKEISFFAHNKRFDRGLRWYLEEYFSLAPPEARWGTASPHYMIGTKNAPIPTVVERMHDLVPDVRLIALLRDPIDRAFSEYQLIVRRNLESRSFSDAMREQLDPDEREHARFVPSKRNAYLVQGEYGRILGLYLERFRPEQLLPLATAELEQRSVRTMRRVFEHIGVDADHLPSNLDEVYHQGGTGRRVDPEAEAALKKHMQEYVWPRIPDPLLARDAMWEFFYWFRQWNIVPDDRSRLELDQDVRTALEKHYRKDGELLRELTGFEAPWLESWGRETTSTVVKAARAVDAPAKPDEAGEPGSKKARPGKGARKPGGGKRRVKAAARERGSKLETKAARGGGGKKGKKRKKGRPPGGIESDNGLAPRLEEDEPTTGAAPKAGGGEPATDS